MRESVSEEVLLVPEEARLVLDQDEEEIENSGCGSSVEFESMGGAGSCALPSDRHQYPDVYQSHKGGEGEVKRVICSEITGDMFFIVVRSPVLCQMVEMVGITMGYPRQMELVAMRVVLDYP